MLKFFIDFDGTISMADVVDVILERFASPDWRKIEEDWQKGNIGSRECLEKQINLLRITDAELRCVIENVEIDPHFVSFLQKAAQVSVPVTIVSDGFDLVIRGVMERYLKNSKELLKNTSIFSNKILWAKDRLTIQFPEGPVCEHACANCKARVIDESRRDGERVVFIGDGLSDRFAAHEADLVFAKGKLLRYCSENGINHKKFESFSDIKKWLTAASAACLPAGRDPTDIRKT